MTRDPGVLRDPGPLAASAASAPRPGAAAPRYAGFTPRRDMGLAAYELVLGRAGFSPVAGIDEAGRGASAGPLVIAAVVLDPATIKRIPGLADSKLLSPQAREDVYTEVLRWAVDWHVVVIDAGQIDAVGLHVCNVAGMRRAYAGLRCQPGYVLTDGFPVRGLGAPALAVWKGDRVTASVAAASVVAKVSRDRMMRDLHERYPQYGFDRHKGYNTDDHERALAEHGPCPAHRYSFVNVNRAAALTGLAPADQFPAEPGSAEPGSAGLGSAGLVRAEPVPAQPDPAGAVDSAAAAGLDPAAALVPSLAGVSGENERRISS